MNRRRSLWPAQSHLALVVHTMRSEYSDYEATLANFFTQKYLEFIFENSQDYCVDIGLCACKRISLDGNYFVGIFHVEVGEKNLELTVSTVCTKQGKNYHKSTNIQYICLLPVYL